MKSGVLQLKKRKNEFNAIVDDCNNLCGYIRLLDKNAGFNIVNIYKKDTPIGCGEFIKMQFTY